MLQHHRPEVGQVVLAADGAELGGVREVVGAFMRIDAPMKRDYWLNLSTIESIEGNFVVLSITSDAIDDHKRHDPETSPAPGAPA
jgi:hypothetical protein